MKYELEWQRKSYRKVKDMGPSPTVGDILICTKNKGKDRTAFVVTKDELSNYCSSCDMSYRSCVHYWFDCKPRNVLKKLDTIMEEL